LSTCRNLKDTNRGERKKEVEEVRGKEERCEKIMKNRRSGRIVGALRKKRGNEESKNLGYFIQSSW